MTPHSAAFLSTKNKSCIISALSLGTECHKWSVTIYLDLCCTDGYYQLQWWFTQLFSLKKVCW